MIQHDGVVIPLELLEGVLTGYRSDRCNLRLCSDSFVYRWQIASPAPADIGHPDIYVKAQRLANKRDPAVSREAAVMRWLHETHPSVAANTLPVPKVLVEVAEGGAGFVATEALSGTSSHTLVTRSSSRNAIVATVRSNARALRRLHDSVDTARCPFQCDIASEIAAARGRLCAQILPLDEWCAIVNTSGPGACKSTRWVVTDDCLYRELDHTPEAELQRLEVLADSTFSQDLDLVFTHGDYCAPNVLVGNAPLHPVTGVVDWGYAGVADRWRDIVKALWSIGFNFGEEWKQEWLHTYGVEYNNQKAEFYDRLTAFL
eukprot:COSAG02_NODE_6006_length_3880_cov_2.898440_2_plen_317_part_00